MPIDYYRVLGVARDATLDDIKRAYRKLALQYHPDRNDGDKGAEERFKEASEAYEVLRDPEKRARYDRFGDAGLREAAGFGAFHPDLAEALSIFMRDFGGMGGFEAFFGGGGRREQRTRRRGQDVRLSMRVTLAEVATGTTRTVRLRTLQPCATCHATGSKPGSESVTCRTCGGVGEVRRATQSLLGQLVSVTACPACHGEGNVVQDLCAECRGDGRIRGEQTVDIEIPAGVSANNYLTLRGKGQAGPRGGPPGDLVVILEVEDDPRFERAGDDLAFDLPVSFSQAALGHRFDVPTPTGTVAVDIPSGTQSGTVIRVRGEGLPALDAGRRGDLHVRVRVWTPPRMTAEMKKLFQRLKAIEGQPPSDESLGARFWNRVKETFGT